MPFCGKCGTRIDESDSFCPQCGTPRFRKQSAPDYRAQKSAREVFEGAVHKCPNCGAPVTGMQVQCEMCGYEFRTRHSGGSVKELSRKLEQIEQHRQDPTFLNQLAKLYGLGSYSKASVAKANLITTFAIPHTKEDIMEFIVLAAGNIVPSVYSGSWGESYVTTHDLKIETNAWYTKMEQAYNQAKLSFPNDPLFLEVEQIYKAKKEEVNQAKKKKAIATTLGIVIPLLVLVGLFVFSVLSMRACMRDIMNGDYSYSIEDHEPANKEDERLLEIAQQVEEKIDNEDYDEARELAEQLYYESTGPEDSHLESYWDTVREMYLEEIETLDIDY